MTITARASTVAVFVVLIGLASAEPSQAAPCNLDGDGAAEVALARAQVQAACGCPADDSVRTWRRCVRNALQAVVASGEVSRACSKKARKIESASTCGRSDRIVCCRTNASRRMKATVRTEARCTPPRNGTACVSEFSYTADGCTQTGCVQPPQCGDGNIDEGETCDPPDGSSCNENCQVAPCQLDAPGTLLSCHEGSTAVDLTGIDGTFLASFNGLSEQGKSLVQIQRFDSGANLLDAAPVPISTATGDATDASFATSSATAGDTSFHVAMTGSVPTQSGSFSSSVFRRREVPTSGPPSLEPVQIDENLPFGICSLYISGPIGLAAGFGADEVYSSFRNIYSCEGTTLGETITGVPGGFTFPPPGNLSEGPAPLARGASEVAGVWWNRAVTNLSPLVDARSLRAGWLISPPAQGVDLIQVPAGLEHSFSPKLAASGDVFLAVWAAAEDSASNELTTLRAARFTRAKGPLDGPDGLLLQNSPGVLQAVAAGNAAGFHIAYTEAAPGGLRVLALTVGLDGSSTVPTTVATIPSGSAIEIAATSAAVFLGYSSPGQSGHSSVRVIRLDP